MATTSLILTGILAGPSDINLRDVFRELTSSSGDAVVKTIIWDMRIPRMFVSLLAGGCLGLAGVLIQLSTRSPLGDPNLFGIGGGAAIFLAVVAAGFLPLGHFGIFFGSICSSLLIAILLSKLISKDNLTPIRIAIIGIAVGSLTIAIGTSVISHGRVFPSQVIGLVSGSFTSSTWLTVYYLLPTLCLSLVISMIISKRFYPIMLGDVLSRSLGVNPVRTRTITMTIVAVLSGTSVYAGGLIGFVGLMSPHIARRIFGNTPLKLVIGSVWIGSITTIFADQIARLLFAPIELPVGMITTVMGAPVMMYLALRIR